jgi:transcriptional regulator with XRE-family HTH domain
LASDANALRLRVLLELHGLPKNEVARAAGVTAAMVSRWLAGTKRPSEQQAARIAALIAAQPLFDEARR